ncbi:MAG: hypothetical protein ACI9OU_002757 [Candidatus Promineifilaceae bacterium]|jgi:hypothetical protein
MKADVERNMGPQPLKDIMEANALKAHDLVAASSHPMTHKMVSRAVKGRRLTPNTKTIVVNALNAATGREYAYKDVFNY